MVTHIAGGRTTRLQVPLDAGAAGCVWKEFDLSELIAAVRATVD
jgi:DNA-binding response OmpR family regulator